METDWQLEKLTLKDRYEHLWKTGEKADCHFRAGGKTFPAHKLILFAASPVFEGMFYGEMAEPDGFIEIADIEAEDFKDLLYYVYCNTFEIKKLEKATNLYYAAKKYMLNGLTKSCIEFITKNAKVENACEIFEFAKFYEENELLNVVKKIIQQSPSNSIKSAVNRVDISTVISILDEKSLSDSEFALFIALKHLAIIQNVIPPFDENTPKSMIDSELELFHKLEELSKVQGVFAEEISAKALEVVNENKENVQAQHLRDFRNIQRCFVTTKNNIFQTLNEISKIKGNKSLEITPAVAAKPTDNVDNAIEDVRLLMSEDNRDDDGDADMTLKDGAFADENSAVCKRTQPSQVYYSLKNVCPSCIAFNSESHQIIQKTLNLIFDVLSSD